MSGIKIRNKRSVEFSTASMSDLVFLLLVFFILVSTIVSPNAIPLTLPNSSSQKVIDSKKDVTVYINDQLQYFINDDQNQIAESDLPTALGQYLNANAEGNVILRVDKKVAVQYIVNVIDAVNKHNVSNTSTYKVILATQPM
jgi:biopolymer transport protein ExbD